MKKLLATLFCLSAVALARADFTSYTLVSQTDPLTFAPVVSFTFDSLSINMTGNTPAGQDNFTADSHTGSTIVLSFTDTTSIVGDSVELLWLFPTATTVFETFAAVPVPGTVFAGSGAGNFTITGNTVTIVNQTEGWTAASFNGFEILDVTRQAQGGPSVPDTSSTLLLVGAAMVGLVVCRRGFGFSKI
ncbi:MAG TPA: hypothetical protein VII09_08640 [Opitutaceae bacterium]